MAETVENYSEGFETQFCVVQSGGDATMILATLALDSFVTLEAFGREFLNSLSQQRTLGRILGEVRYQALSGRRRRTHRTSAYDPGCAKNVRSDRIAPWYPC